jgi:hypothetical protein
VEEEKLGSFTAKSPLLFSFRDILGEIKNHLHFGKIFVRSEVVVDIDIRLQLQAVTDNLFAPLRERSFHMIVLGKAQPPPPPVAHRA